MTLLPEYFGAPEPLSELWFSPVETKGSLCHFLLGEWSEPKAGTDIEGCFVGARQGPNARPARKAFDARSRLGWGTITGPRCGRGGRGAEVKLCAQPLCSLETEPKPPPLIVGLQSSVPKPPCGYKGGPPTGAASPSLYKPISCPVPSSFQLMEMTAFAFVQQPSVY